MTSKILKIFLRLALASSFLSAVADRLGMWPSSVSVWGDWATFLDYTQLINPWFPPSTIPILGALVTGLEILFAMALLLGFKTEFFGKLSGILILIFALSMTFSTGIKGAFDYSVFSAAAAAFCLGQMKDKFLELDLVFQRGLAN